MSEQHNKPLRVRESEALSGELPVPGGRSMFRILLDEETVGAKQFALLINEFDPGLTSTAHKHDAEEHAFYIISGTGVIDIEGRRFRSRRVTRFSCLRARCTKSRARVTRCSNIWFYIRRRDPTWRSVKKAAMDSPNNSGPMREIVLVKSV